MPIRGVYEHRDPKEYAFLALHHAFGRMINLGNAFSKKSAKLTPDNNFILDTFHSVSKLEMLSTPVLA